MNILSTLALVLMLGPPESAEALSPEDWDAMSYHEVNVQLERGIEIGDRQPEEAISILEPALAALPRFTTQLVEDRVRLELRAEAYVSLARAYLTVREEDKARAAMDEGIRSAPFGQVLPAERYGPKVEKLWEERVAALGEAALGEAVVECWVACRVYLNEREVEVVEGGEGEPARVVLDGLTEGSYRLWVEAVEGELEPVVEAFQAQEGLVFSLGTEPEPEVEEVIGPGLVKDEQTKEPIPTPPSVKRPLLPRAAEISAIAAGVGLIASGVVLFAINDRCSNPPVDGAVPGDGIEACPKLWNTGAAGIALIGAGVGLTAIGSVFLGIDEVRRGQAKKYARVTVGWTFRF